MNLWRRRPSEPETPQEPISQEDLAWRIGASEIRPSHFDEDDEALWDAVAAAAAASRAATARAAMIEAGEQRTSVEPGEPEVLSGDDAAAAERAAAVAAAAGPGLLIGDRGSRIAAPPLLRPRLEPRPAHAVQRSLSRPGSRFRSRGNGGPRRVLLWRDVSALLFVVVAIALIAQLGLSRNSRVAVATVGPTPTLEPSLVAVAPTGTPAPTVLITLGPVVNPSLIPVIEATPTPVPTITLPPATARPTPRPTPRATPRPTPKPTPTPTPKPTPTPTPAPPVAKFTVSAQCGSAPLTVNFNASSSTGTITSYSWDFDDGSGSGIAASHTYLASGTYNVILTVVGPGGTSFASTAIKVPC